MTAAIPFLFHDAAGSGNVVLLRKLADEGGDLEKI